MTIILDSTARRALLRLAEEKLAGPYAPRIARIPHGRLDTSYAIACEADLEIAQAHAAVDNEIDQALPLNERIAVLKMQRDAYAQDLFDTLKSTVDAEKAVDPEIDPGLPLHERIAIMKMQRDSYADFTEQAADLLGCDGESGSDILDALKATVDTADEVGSVAAERQRTIDNLRERLAIAEAELANLRGVPEQWRKACEERDVARGIAEAITGYPFDMLVGRSKADDPAAPDEEYHRTVRKTLKYEDGERGFDLATLDLGGDPPYGIEKAERTNRARAVLAHWLAIVTGVEERQIAAAAWDAEDAAAALPAFLGVIDGDDFAGIMDGPEMMPVESDEEPRR